VASDDKVMVHKWFLYHNILNNGSSKLLYLANCYSYFHLKRITSKN